MTKKYRKKQTVINEQNEKIENLEDKIRFAGYREDTHKRMLTHEARKLSDLTCPVATITVFEDTYRPVEEPSTVLASLQLYD